MDNYHETPLHMAARSGYTDSWTEYWKKCFVESSLNVVIALSHAVSHGSQIPSWPDGPTTLQRFSVHRFRIAGNICFLLVSNPLILSLSMVLRTFAIFCWTLGLIPRCAGWRVHSYLKIGVRIYERVWNVFGLRLLIFLNLCSKQSWWRFVKYEQVLCAGISKNGGAFGISINATQDIGPIGIELAGVLNHSMPTVPSVPLKSTP